MDLFLVRHGEALPVELDSQQSLSDEGIATAKMVGNFFHLLNLRFDMILSSPKNRAKQTANILAKETLTPLPNITITEKLTPLTPAYETAKEIKQYTYNEKILIVGHLPNLQELSSFLLSPSNSLQIDLPTCSSIYIHCNSLDQNGGKLIWLMPPQYLRRIFS